VNEAEGLVVIVPSRGRPAAVSALVVAFEATCSAMTRLLVVVDDDDPDADRYREAMEPHTYRYRTSLLSQPGGSMVAALNAGAAHALTVWPHAAAIGFLGDDHRPRTAGWDAAYLAALAERPGFVYGDDRIQGVNLPTQIAISTSVVRALGHMAPPVLHHLYVDNYWRTLGQTAGCITYLPEVVVEHLHPVAGTAPVDDGYLRVNAPEVYAKDRAAFQAYMAEHGHRDVLAVLQAAAAVPR
jgi:hypothetical protein